MTLCGAPLFTAVLLTLQPHWSASLHVSEELANTSQASRSLLEHQSLPLDEPEAMAVENCFMDGIVYQDFAFDKNTDIGQQHVASAMACQAACQEVHNCVGFSFWPTKGKNQKVSTKRLKSLPGACFLKSRIGTPRHQTGSFFGSKSKPVISGPRNCVYDRPDLDTFWDEAGNPRPEAHAKIICPVLAGLWKRGQLKTSRQGVATREQIAQGFTHVGMGAAATKILNSKLHQQIGNNDLNIFEMEGDPRIEHKYATGIRDPSEGPPSEERFAQFVASAEAEQMWGYDKVVDPQSFKNARIYYFGLAQQSKGMGHVRTEEFNFNEGGHNLMSAVFAFLLMAFGHQDQDEVYLTASDLHDLFFNADWPQGWERNDWSAFDWVLTSMNIHGALDWWPWQSRDTECDQAVLGSVKREGMHLFTSSNCKCPAGKYIQKNDVTCANLADEHSEEGRKFNSKLFSGKGCVCE